VLPINQLTPGQLALGAAYLNQSVANPFAGLPGVGGVIAASTVTRAQLLLPFPEYSTISENTTYAKAQYDSLAAKVQKRFSHGVTFLSTLTWSKNLDNEVLSGGSNAFNGLGGAATGGVRTSTTWERSGRWQPPTNPSGGPSHGPINCQLPFGTGKPWLNNNKPLNWFVGGWSFNGTSIIGNGEPMFIIQTDLNATIGSANQRPNATGVNACGSAVRNQGSPATSIRPHSHRPQRTPSETCLVTFPANPREWPTGTSRYSKPSP
jgi:trimeric autotransporter adhesin